MTAKPSPIEQLKALVDPTRQQELQKWIDGNVKLINLETFYNPKVIEQMRADNTLEGFIQSHKDDMVAEIAGEIADQIDWEQVDAAGTSGFKVIRGTLLILDARQIFQEPDELVGEPDDSPTAQAIMALINRRD